MLYPFLIGAILTGIVNLLAVRVTAMNRAEHQLPDVGLAPDKPWSSGLCPEDCSCVHEQFIDRNAEKARRRCWPATTFLEHDDISRAADDHYIIWDPKAGRAAPMPQTSLGFCELAKRVRRLASGVAMTLANESTMLRVSKRGTLSELEAIRWIDFLRLFEKAHYLDGCHWPDGKFRFSRTGQGAVRIPITAARREMPVLPDYWTSIEQLTKATLSASPRLAARGFLIRHSTRRPTSLAAGKSAFGQMLRDAQGIGASACDLLVRLGNRAARCACTRGFRRSCGVACYC